MTDLLGIETSCDETAAAVVGDGRTVRSSMENMGPVSRHPVSVAAPAGPL